MAMTPTRLYLHCVRWGLATGAVSGAATGAGVGFAAGIGERLVEMLVGLPLVAACYGAFFGIVFSLVPTAFGALLVTGFVRRRHPRPCSTGSLRRDLGVVFCLIAAALDVGYLLAVVGLDGGLATVGRTLHWVVLANAAAGIVLNRARASIAQAWYRP